ncbi:type VII secretion target [Actinosynnema sp. CS-041913]|uniref:type VII secretion target n=1 Tax=Actinosynnema sp. CS-041913 TaxID=3239917 RepID=UPI003D8CE10B
MFTADTARMRKAANGFRQAGEQVDAVASTLAGVTVPAGAFGSSGPATRLAAIFDAALSRRTERLRHRRDRLSDIADRIGRDADAYDESDAAGTAHLNRAGAR